MKKWTKRTAALFVIAVLFTTGASAALPYNGYNYDAWGASVPSPNSYQPKALYSGVDLSEKVFNKPSDLFVTESGDIYISDTGNNRIVVVDKSFKLIRIIDSILTDDEKIQKLTAPEGIFVDDKNQVYVALPEEKRVVLLDGQNHLLQEFLRPESDLLEDNLEFKPNRVVVNKFGTVFILVRGLYLGAVTYDRNGQFLGFFGANEVTLSVELMVSYMWKKVMTQKQINKMERYVPVSYSSFDIDGNNFIYTSTIDSYNTHNEICKLNSLGDRVLIQHQRNVRSLTGDYGDLERARYKGNIVDTQFIDLCIDKNGLIFALDKTRGRIFEYDQESKLLSIFGAIGNQKGSFQNPVAIDKLEDQVMVLDQDKGTITVFEPTEYGALVEKAVLLYNDGHYSEAKSIWQEVIKRNVNSELAYMGIGKALFEEGKYKEALSYFKNGYDRVGYSRAYKEYRMIVSKRYLPYVFSALIVLILAVKFFFIRKHKKGKEKGHNGIS